MDEKTRDALQVGRVTPLSVPRDLEERLRGLTAKIKSAETLAERERCAALVEARDCLCGVLGVLKGRSIDQRREPHGHFDECPKALAAAIREGA